jgi:hypothetical protein
MIPAQFCLFSFAIDSAGRGGETLSSASLAPYQSRLLFFRLLMPFLVRPDFPFLYLHFIFNIVDVYAFEGLFNPYSRPRLFLSFFVVTFSQ